MEELNYTWLLSWVPLVLAMGLRRCV